MKLVFVLFLFFCFVSSTISLKEASKTFYEMQKDDANNCKKEQLFFEVIEDSKVFFNEANSDGPCIINLLALQFENPLNTNIRFEGIITSSNDSYEILSNQKPYFTINSMDSLLWKDTTIYADHLVIIIPPSQSINITAKANTDDPIIIDQTEQRGVLASLTYSGYDPNFGDNNYNKFVQLYQLNNNLKFEVHFFVKSISGNATVMLQTSMINVTLSTNQSITTSDTVLKIFYRQQNISTDSFFIEYAVIQLTHNITLNDENVYQIFWLDYLRQNDYFIVCADGDELEMFFTFGEELYDQKNYTVYDGIGFKNSVGTLADIQHNFHGADYPISITSNSSCFTIKNTNGFNTYATMLFRMKTKQREFCNGRNVFEQPSYLGNQTKRIVASADKDKECEIIILSKNSVCFDCSPFVSMEAVSGGSDNYKFKNAMNENPLMQINNTETNQWKNVSIYTNALSITFTNSTIINLNFISDKFDISNVNVILSAGMLIQKGVFASPRYSGLPNSVNDVMDAFYNITNNQTMALNLNVKEIEDIVALVIDGVEYPITKNTMLFGKSFQLIPQNNTSNYFLIEYSLMAINKNSYKNLEADSTTYVLWLDDMDTDNMITVCSHDEPDRLELFVPNVTSDNLRDFLLFDGNEIVGSLLSAPFVQTSSIFPLQIISSTGCFRLYKTADHALSIPVLFRLKYANSRGCDTANVYVPSSSGITNITARAAFEDCEITLLAPQEQDSPPVIYIHSIRSSARDNITIKSTINQNTLAEFSGFDAIDWKDLYFYTPAVSFVIAKETTIVFEMKNVISNQTIVQNLEEYQQGIFASYAFNGFKKLPSHIKFLNNNCGINFNVNNLTDEDDVILKMGNKSHKFTPQDNFTTYEENLEISSSSFFSISYGIFNCPVVTTTTDTRPINNGLESFSMIKIVILFIIAICNLNLLFSFTFFTLFIQN